MAPFPPSMWKRVRVPIGGPETAPLPAGVGLHEPLCLHVDVKADLVVDPGLGGASCEEAQAATSAQSTRIATIGCTRSAT